MNDILNASVVAAVIASVLTFVGQYIVTERARKKKIRHKRLTKLLLPLYMAFKEEDIFFAVEDSWENGDPMGFLSELPNFYKPIVSVVKENLHLADNEFTKKALKFIAWVYVDAVDTLRTDKAMFGKLEDKALYEFKNYITTEYKKERDYFLK